MISSKSLKQGNMAAILLALVTVLIILAWQQYSFRSIREARYNAYLAAVPEEWFVVRNVAVPDFIEGTDPLISYAREIRKQFVAQWIVEVHPVGVKDNFAICTGSGVNNYEPFEQMPENGVTLSWFIGKNCNLKQGKYILDATWSIMSEDMPPKVVRFGSNPFMVLPRGSQLYLTPEQVQKLGD
jgi:hypothetical protein